MNNSTKTILGIFVALAVIAAIRFIPWGTTTANAAVETFAKCLAAKNVVMYGAEWCPHCKNQKQLFGTAFKYVPYVECPENTQKCIAAGIEGYPTWITPDGTKLVGEQSFQQLSEASSCPFNGASASQ